MSFVSHALVNEGEVSLGPREEKRSGKGQGIGEEEEERKMARIQRQERNL